MQTDGWIVPPEHRFATPNIHRHELGVVRPVEFLVYHYTVGNKAGAISTLTDPKSGASAHFVVDRDGTVYQLASLLDRTWHAGGTKQKPSSWIGAGQVNDRSIGIEVVNWGPLLVLDGIAHPIDYPGVQVSAVVECEHPSWRFWEAYGPKQVDALVALTDHLADYFPILHLGDPAVRLTGHENVDPGRKIDPGPAFPWQIIRGALAPAASSPGPDSPDR